MSSISHRAVELIVGVGLIGYGSYALWKGEVRGKFRSYSRSEEPWSFWLTVLITGGIGAVFLFGKVSWRN